MISCVPSITKNNVMKKSLKGLTLLLISSLYGKFASDKPAKNPTEILPYNDCKSCFSESNLTIMIVLLNVKAMEIYTDSITEKLSKYFVIKYPMIKVNIIWPMPVIREVLPTCLTSLKLSSMPTKNNKNAIPNSEKNLIVSMLLDPAKNWLNIIPVKIYASINGCFINLTK